MSGARPREFWVVGCTAFIRPIDLDEYCARTNEPKEQTHVIEKSAYNTAVAALKSILKHANTMVEVSNGAEQLTVKIRCEQALKDLGEPID